MVFLIVFLLTWTLSPGPVAVLTLNRSKQFGQASGIAVAAGATLSTLLIFAGILLTQHLGYDILLNDGNSTLVERFGAIFIVFVGLASGYKVLFMPVNDHEAGDDLSQKPRSFLHGMVMVVASIPQSLIFYAVLIPQNFDPVNVFSAIVGFGTIKVALMFIWHVAIAVLAQRVQGWLGSPRLSKGLDFATAGLLVAFGLNALV